MISQVDGGRPAAARPGRAIRPVAGVLPDGTAFFAPVGEVILDGPKVVCHLCGRSLRSVAAHLAAHGWTKEKYCKAFGLERSQPLEGPETRKLRAAALTARLIFDPAIRAGSAAGRQRARSGDLARDAAAAARGRPFPEQRRRKAAQRRDVPGGNRTGAPGARGSIPGRGRGRRGPAARAAGPPGVRPGPDGGGRQPGRHQPRGRTAQGLDVAPPRRRRPGAG